ncbi:MAG: ATP-binding protein [Planctomycetota bacterium]
MATGAVLLALGSALYQRDLAEARERWALGVDPETRGVANAMTDVFRTMYEGLRTIARLPGVRGIDRYARDFDSNARQTVQEIYNNLATHVEMSEVYIVPLDLDPDAIDPNTGELQEPIVTFDELIVGRTAPQAAARGADGEPAADDHDELEEVEIHEYRLMRRQLARFAELCPTEDSIRGLDYPALAGPEVVTCDNRFVSPANPDDAARSGIVYSVPLFGADGMLRGCVSGVILTRALRIAMPGGNHALRHARHGLLCGAFEGGVWDEHLDSIAAGVPAPDLVYSRVTPLPIVDAEPGWLLWSGRANAEFESSPESLQAHATFAALAITSVVLALGLGLRERTLGRRRAENQRRTRELEAACSAAENLGRARTNLVAVTSQEIRTPITGLLRMTDTLLQSELQPEQRTLIESARQSTRTLVDLLDGILQYSEIDTGQLRVQSAEFDVHALLENVLELMAPVAAEKPIEFTLLLGDGLPTRLVGDATRLRQIVASLVNNALKFTNQGAVGIRADWFVTQDRPLLCIRVSDTGVGLDQELLGRLFEPFTLGQGSLETFGGMGLGLAICRGLAEAMGGSVDHLPTPHGGTTFVVTLPVDLPTIRSVPPRPLQRRRVLVVTGRARYRSMLRLDLSELGADVTCVPTSADALVALAAAATPYSVAIVDGALADDGALPFARTVAAQFPELPVVLTNAWASPAIDAGRLPPSVVETIHLPLGRSSLHRAVLRSLQPVQPGHAPLSTASTSAPAPVEDGPAVAFEPSLVDARRLRDEAPSAPSTSQDSDQVSPESPLATTRSGGRANHRARPGESTPSTDAAIGEPQPPGKAPRAARPRRVLVVDESEADLLITCAQIRRFGHETLQARSEAEASRMCAGDVFDAILVGRKATGLNAVATARALRALELEAARDAAPIVGVLDAAVAEEREECLAAGMNEVLLRPLAAASLGELLAKLMS